MVVAGGPLDFWPSGDNGDRADETAGVRVEGGPAADVVREIKRLALVQLATGGAGELSLRAIARELNLVSSAIYRYYAGRDELITALIVDAYDELAERLEDSGDPIAGALAGAGSTSRRRGGLGRGSSRTGSR